LTKIGRRVDNNGMEAADNTKSRPVRSSSEQVRSYILDHVSEFPTDIAAATAFNFGITRQAVHRHIKRLVDAGELVLSGNTKSRLYSLPSTERDWTFSIDPNLAEHEVWYGEIEPSLDPLPKNVLDIWDFCFTEMLNNAIDHSGGTHVVLTVIKNAKRTTILVYDNGIGIFRKIQLNLQLPDEKNAVLELAKGKFTSDPENHTGQGIFFTSRMLDEFSISAGTVFFEHTTSDDEDWIVEKGERFVNGTLVAMTIDNDSKRDSSEVFKSFSSSDEDCEFSKTVVPVSLAQYGRETLVSRSQAKRVLSRVDRFKTVLLNFAGVKTIGPAFADQVFRVFANAHPEIALMPINENERIAQIIKAARASSGGTAD